MTRKVKHAIQEIKDQFEAHNRDGRKFTVDLDEVTNGIFCHYTPDVNDSGFAVTTDLAIVHETTKSELRQIKSFCTGLGIKSRPGWEWDPEDGEADE